jgi:heme/copper-type cytochrome/quinol oxidase subunit 3
MLGHEAPRLLPRPVGPVRVISTVLTAIGLAVATAIPDWDARSELARWFDLLEENTLPAWWGAAVLLAAAIAFALAGAAVRAGAVAGAGAWFTGALIIGMFSLAEVSEVHRRFDGIARLVLGDSALTQDWATTAALLAPVVAAVLVVPAARLGAPSGRLFAAGGVLLLVSAVGGEYLAARLGGGTGPGFAPLLVAHLGELGENVGAALLLAAALRALVLARDGDALLVRHRAASPGGVAVPVRLTAVWWWLGGVSVALALLSLGFVLAAPGQPPLREVRLYVDLLVEHNLPTWWSVALLATAALSHLAAFAAARNARAPGAGYWLVTAAVLTVLSLDDQSQLHERTEQLGRLMVS